MGDAELTAEFADFVFEEFAEGFDEAEALAFGHAFGEATDVVVRFDGGAGAFEGYAFDYVGVERSLEEPFYLSCFGGVGRCFFDLEG